MSEGYHALTEKEKQTLRLLVSGYDAKSMAKNLGLSVHTVNERLRDARRKMATSSSREAARLLHELEARTPELLGDKALGDALAPVSVERLQASEEPAGRMRQPILIIGGLMMSFALALYALTALTGSDASPASGQPPAAASVPSDQAAVLEAARQWQALVDAEDWYGSYKVMGAQFRALNTVERWTEVSQRVHGELGAIRTRELLTVDYAPAPPHGYWMVKYRANYAKRTGVVETLTLAFEDGAWRVTGVMID